MATKRSTELKPNPAEDVLEGTGVKWSELPDEMLDALLKKDIDNELPAVQELNFESSDSKEEETTMVTLDIKFSHIRKQKKKTYKAHKTVHIHTHTHTRKQNTHGTKDNITLFIYSNKKEIITLKVNNDILCENLVNQVAQMLECDAKLLTLKEGKDPLIHRKTLSHYKKDSNIILHAVINPPKYDIHFNIDYIGHNI